MTDAPVPPPKKKRMVSAEAKRRKDTLSAVMVSVIVHVVLLFMAASLTIMVIMPKPKMTFDGKKNPSLPARKLEHSIRVKQMQKQTRKPQVLQRMVTEAPSKVAMPQVDIKTPEAKNLKDNMITAGAGNIGSLGMGGGAGRGLGGGGGYSDAKFFGESFTTRAVAICMDVSPSMVNKGVTKDVLNETIKMLSEMRPNSQFNIIIFVDGAASFAPQMVYATQENKAKALEWLKQPFTGRGVEQGNRPGYSGSTPGDAIPMAVEMGADTIFILTDDPPYLKKGDSKSGVEIPTHMADIERYVKGIESTVGYQVRIYPILYKPNQNKRGELGKEYYKKLAKTTGGKAQVVMKLDK